MTICPPPPQSAIGKLGGRARRAARALEESDLQLVLAESCTAGMVAGMLGGVPGISRHLCGSSVVYQAETKIAWLELPTELLARLGTVAPDVSDELARQVLQRTPHADVAVAVTGHLGPQAPPELDGMIYVAVRFLDGRTKAAECRLPPSDEDAGKRRRDRQRLAVAFVLEQIEAACAATFGDPASE